MEQHQTTLLAPQGPVVQPLVHNKTRGIVVIIGCVLAGIFAFSGLFTNLYGGTNFVDNGDGFNTIEIDTKISLWKVCISVQGQGNAKCEDIMEVLTCDSLKSQFRTMRVAYAATAATLALDMLLGIADFAGGMRIRFVHSMILAGTVAASLAAFIVTINTYNNYYCGNSFSDVNNTVFLDAAPFLTAVAGVGAFIGVIVTLAMKDTRPIPPPAPSVVVVQNQQPAPVATGVVYQQHPAPMVPPPGPSPYPTQTYEYNNTQVQPQVYQSPTQQPQPHCGA